MGQTIRILVLSILMCGCCTEKPSVSFRSGNIVITCCSPQKMKELFAISQDAGVCALYGTTNKFPNMYRYTVTPNGMFCNQGGINYIFVRWSDIPDKNGKLKPDFYQLGHEIWHIKEFGGDFHE